MLRITIFTSAFLIATAVVLLLLPHSVLNTEAQSRSTETEQVVYEILPGLQRLDSTGSPQATVPSLWTTSLPSSRHGRAFDFIIAGALADLSEWNRGQLTKNQPVYSVIRHVSGDHAELTAVVYEPNPNIYRCKGIDVQIRDADKTLRAHIRYAHT